MRSRPTPTHLVVLLGALLLAACGGGGDGARPASTTTAAGPSVAFTAGPVTVERTAAGGDAAPNDVEDLLEASAAYVRAASLDPMAGRPAALTGLTTPEAAARTAGPDAEAFTDAGMGRVEDLRIRTTPAPITILTDATGTAVLAAVTIDVTITGETTRGPVTVHRTGELAFTRSGDAWLLDSWRLQVTREGRGVPAGTRPSSTTEAR